MSHKPSINAPRQAESEIEPLFLQRWSPRAMSAEPVKPEHLQAVFEAARWAPSCYNDQPWHFLYATRQSADWAAYLDLLVPANQIWAQHAGVLVVLVSRKVFAHNAQASRTHAFDCGAAWQNLALQGTALGLVVHAMAGFDQARAQQQLALPETFEVQVMIAIGQAGDIEQLPQALREKEYPSARRPVSAFAWPGSFKDKPEI